MVKNVTETSADVEISVDAEASVDTANVAPEEEEAPVAEEAPAQDVPNTEVSKADVVEFPPLGNDVPSKEISKPTVAEPVEAPAPVEEVRNPDLTYFLWKGWTDTLDLPDGTVIGKKKPVGVNKEVADFLLNSYYYAKDLELA